VNLLLPGMYMAADSILHRLDPRVKMGAALALMTLPFAVHSLVGYALLTAFVALLAALSATPPIALLRTLRTILLLGCLMFFFYLFTTPGRPLVAVGRVVVTWEGLLTGAVQIYRLCLLVVVSALLTFTTSPAQLAHGLEVLLAPLQRVGLPVREFALVMTIALRFVPALSDEIDKIAKAQQARGVDMTSKNPLRQMRSWAPLFVPIFVAAFRRAEELATAMEARGFRGAAQRTRLYPLQLTHQDLVAAVTVLAFCLAFVGIDRLT
jgi:energy-coupling factor transport system permease protein